MTANPSIIDTMARAIANTGAVGDHWADLSPPDRDDYRREARAALRSLLEAGPTEAMVEAAKDERATHAEGTLPGRAFRLMFIASIRAALEEADNAL